MLTTNLARYEEIEVVSSQRLHDILKIIGKQDIEVITKDIATQVAKHAGVETMMLGSIIKIGDRIRIPVQLCDVQSGTVTGSEQVEGEKVEDLFDMADRLTVKVGSMLGSTADEKQPLKIAEVTTSSLEAYKYFLKGQEAYEKMYYNEANQFFEKALTLDSTYALAHTFLSFIQSGEAKKRSLKKAMIYSEKSPERERLMIEAAYALFVEDNTKKMFNKFKEVVEKYPDFKYGHYYLGRGYESTKQYDKAIAAFRKALELDPQYGSALNQLAYKYSDIGDYNKAIEYLQRYAAVSPGDANPLDSMGDMYYWMGKIDNAITMYQEALKVKPDFVSALKVPYMYALKENYTESMKWIDNYIEIRESVHDKSTGYLLKGYYLYWVGDFDEALINLHMFEELIGTSENSESTVADLIKGLIYYEKRGFDLSRQYLKTFFDQSWHNAIVTYIYNYCSGLLYLKEGNIDSARSSLSEIKALLSEQSGIDQLMIQYCYDYLLAEIFLEENAVEKSIEISRKASTKGKAPLPDVMFWHIRYNLPFTRDVGCRAYLQKGDIDKAITEYEKLITLDPDSEDRRLIHPRMHYRLAKLYEGKGWHIKAIKEYETFLDTWKHADEDMPAVVDARARLAGLRDI
ncbi:MAG: tetratricopeptide repeat protein [bacterium]